ncbi:MAG: hypothetical protein U1B78_03675, partial [Dehalococcoidia bacterium]|nr:hypothetical protein [Dehalococcoidia bacterium]
MTSATSQAGESIPVLDYFPVRWPDPAMEHLHWSWDQVHHPHPETPLTATFEAPACSEGSSRGFQALKIPANYRIFIANGYSYETMEPLAEFDSFPPPWWGDVEQEFLARLPVLTQTWEGEYLPEVQAMNRRLRNFDYAGASMPGLLSFIDETYDLRVRAWDIHMQAVIPVMGAASRFADVYQQLLGEPARGEPYLMLQGFENMTTESGNAFWRLRTRVLEQPALAQIIRETPVARLEEELARVPKGRAFWDEFRRFLDEFGWRSDTFELADPAWVEDPSIPLATLQDYLDAPDGAGPALQEDRAREERERIVRETLVRLDGHEGRPLFEMMLGVSQQYLPIQENHNFYIDQMNTVLLRRPFLELGGRFAQAGA